MRERVCKNCGGRQYKIVGQNMLKCSFCGTLYVDDLANKEEEILLVGANEILREIHFEDAYFEFDKITSLFPMSFEGYFGKSLAKNKLVLYKNKKGTLKTARFFQDQVKLSDDEDFKKAVELAPSEIKKNYLDIAKKIDKTKFEQENYDIFFYADSENLQAEKIYQNIQEKGYKIFHALKQNDEEQIVFPALKTCKVFVYIPTTKGSFYDGDIKSFYDRFMYFVSLKQKYKSGFLVLCEDKNSLPKELLSLNNIFNINSVSILQDLQMTVVSEMEKALLETAKIETRKIEAVEPLKKERAKENDVVFQELGHYKVDNIEPTQQNKLKWVFLLLKNQDFETAKEQIDKLLSEDPNNAQALFAKLLCDKKLSSEDDFFSSLQNFDDKETINKILEFASKPFAENFVDRWEILLESLDNEKFYNDYLLYLAQYNSPNRNNFVKQAKLKAVETLNEELINKVLQCFSASQVDEFIDFYFLLAQKSGSEEYYKKILSLDEGHEQSQIALFLHHFSTVESKLNYQNREEIEKVFALLSDVTRNNFIRAITDMIMPIAFIDLDKVQSQLDFYLGYVSDNGFCVETLKDVAQKFLEMGYFKLAEKYLSLAISKDPKNADLYWQLIKAKAHCKSNNELILTNIKISSMPEWESLISISQDAQIEKYAEIVSKANLYKGQKKPLETEMLDKKTLLQKLENFVLRNQKIISEAEKEQEAGLYYFKLQIKPFESYLQELKSVEDYEQFLELFSKLETRLKALSLSLDASISVLQIQEKTNSLKNIYQPMRKKEIEVKRQVKSIKNDIFLRNFVLVFFALMPLLFSTALFISLIASKESVYAHFNQIFVLCAFFYNIVVGVISFIFALALKKDANTSKRQKILTTLLYIWAFINMLLCLIAFKFDVEDMFLISRV